MIPENIQNLDELKQAKEEYKLLTENINDLIALTNNKFEYEYINEEVTSKLMGYKVDDVLGQPIFKHIHPDDLEYAQNEINRQFKKGEGQGLVRYKHKNGHYEWLEVRAKKFKDVYDEIKILFISRIVTERIEYEQRLKKSEEKYRLITENANDLISVLTMGLKYTYINKKTHKKLLGYDEVDLLGEPLWKFMHPDDIQNLYEKVKKSYKKGKGRASFRFKKRKGGYIWLDVVGVAFHTKYNERLILAISRDISERKKFEELIQKENRRLKNLDKMRKNFISRVSHELKTPMTSIYGAIQLMGRMYNNKLNEKELEIISIAKKGCERLNKLIKNILDASRISSSQLKLKKETINFQGIINNCIDELRYLIKKKTLKLKLDIPDKLFISVDIIRIQEVIINLLSNAIKNSSKNGKISIILKKRNNKVQFCIRDNGIGIKKDDKEKLFKKFGKIERKNMQENIDMEGTGLGLYISKEIINKHGGKIWAESEGENKGASFYFTLPLM
jgi:hypothetical protein